MRPWYVFRERRDLRKECCATGKELETLISDQKAIHASYHMLGYYSLQPLRVSSLGTF
jgi:hypothetical protein